MRYEYPVAGVTYVVTEDEFTKSCDASDGSFHYRFDKRTGDFSRWGHTEADDPQFCPAGPEILDLEVSVNGCPNNCRFCYKGNTNAPAENMLFETFRAIFDKMPKTLTQIAFGITGLQTNPDFFRMMEYARANGVAPNFTLSGIDITPELADKVAALCGAVAVSVYATDKNVGYNTIKMLTDRGMKQVNIHLMVSEETFAFVNEVARDSLKDERLKGLNAIVLLGVKPKGRARGHYTPLAYEKFSSFVRRCLICGVRIGFDSCSAPKFERLLEEFPPALRDKLKEISESCESTLFSSYINQRGEFYPCSFCEGESGWETGVSVLDRPFEAVWHDPRVAEWRGRLLSSSCGGCRACIAFPEINMKEAEHGCQTVGA
jgi:MoaA/NifB/PqqE/SkfB family radical SAM enzyme